MGMNTSQLVHTFLHCYFNTCWVSWFKHRFSIYVYVITPNSGSSAEMKAVEERNVISLHDALYYRSDAHHHGSVL